MRERPLSASSVKTYLQCHLKYHYQYEDKKPRPAKTDALAFGIAVHEALEEAYRLVCLDGRPLNAALYSEVLGKFTQSAVRQGLTDQAAYQEGRELLLSRLDNMNEHEKVLGLEWQFELKTAAGTPFLGGIDRLIELDATTAVVIDYKTSRQALSQEEADVDIQLSMYDLAVSTKYPQYTTIICALDYLRLGEVISHRTVEQRRLFTEFIDAVYTDICSRTTEDVHPSLNFFCPWCDFRGFCPEYKQLLEDPALLLPPVGEFSGAELIAAWDKASTAKKIVDSYQRDLTAVAYERMRHSTSLQGGGKELYRVQTAGKNYDSRQVLKVVGPNEFAGMATVSKGAVDKFLVNNPSYAAELEKAASLSFRAPYFRVRKTRD